MSHKPASPQNPIPPPSAGRESPHQSEFEIAFRLDRLKELALRGDAAASEVLRRLKSKLAEPA